MKITKICFVICDTEFYVKCLRRDFHSCRNKIRPLCEFFKRGVSQKIDRNF